MPCNKNNEKKKPQIKMSYSSPRWTAEIADCSKRQPYDSRLSAGRLGELAVRRIAN